MHMQIATGNAVSLLGRRSQTFGKITVIKTCRINLFWRLYFSNNKSKLYATKICILSYVYTCVQIGCYLIHN